MPGPPHPRATLALAVAVTLVAASSASASQWVLPPPAAAEVSRLVAHDRPLAGGRTIGAAIDGDHVVVTVSEGDAVVTRVTLRHPSVAASGAEVVGGVAVERAPGPVEAAVLTELLERMRASGVTLGWVVAGKATSDGDGRGAREVDGALRDLELGDVDGARRHLERLDGELPVAQAVRAATAWRLIGDDAEVQALNVVLEGGGLGPRAVAAVLGGGPATPEAILALAGEGEPCPLTDAADVLATLGRLEEAIAVAAAIHVRSPSCLPAWVRDIRARVRLGDETRASVVLMAARERFGGDPRLDGAELAVLEARGERAPVESLERLAREDPFASRRLAVLVEAVAGLPADERAAWRQRGLAGGADPIAAFVAGHLALADGDLAAADAALGRVGEELSAVPEVAIDLATVGLGRGDVDAALAHLDRVVDAPGADPTLHYLRAEALRDRDRAAALEALDRYRAGCATVGCSGARTGRLDALRDALERCLAEGVPICVGAWEHQLPGAPLPPDPLPVTESPYVAGEDTNRGVAWPLQVGFVVLAVLALFALYRSRREK